MVKDVEMDKTSVSSAPGKLDVMDERTLTEHVERLRKAHPSLDDRLGTYRAKRKAYDAMRESDRAPADSIQRRKVERRSLV